MAGWAPLKNQPPLKCSVPLTSKTLGGGRYRHTSPRRKVADFSGDPVVQTLPSNARGVSSIPGWGSKISHASRPTFKKRANSQSGQALHPDLRGSLVTPRARLWPWPPRPASLTPTGLGAAGLTSLTDGPAVQLLLLEVWSPVTGRESVGATPAQHGHGTASQQRCRWPRQPAQRPASTKETSAWEADLPLTQRLPLPACLWPFLTTQPHRGAPSPVCPGLGF